MHYRTVIQYPKGTVTRDWELTRMYLYRCVYTHVYTCIQAYMHVYRHKYIHVYVV